MGTRACGAPDLDVAVEIRFYADGANFVARGFEELGGERLDFRSSSSLRSCVMPSQHLALFVRVG